jgi:glutathione S-transferase
VLDTPVSIVFWNLIRTPPEGRTSRPSRADRRGEPRGALLDGHSRGRDFVAGPSSRWATSRSGATLYRWLALDGVEHPVLPTCEPASRLAARPGFRSHVMLPLS